MNKQYLIGLIFVLAGVTSMARAQQAVEPQTGSQPAATTAPAQSTQAPQSPPAAPPANPAGQGQVTDAPAVVSDAGTDIAVVAVEQNVADEEPKTDHESVVGHVGVGFFGVTSLPFAQFDGTTPPGSALRDVAGNNITLAAPSIGLRYWFTELVGLEAAIGIGFSDDSQDVRVDNDTTTVSVTSFGMSFHAGVPLALMYGSHYKFLLIPEMNLGFATGSTNDPDLDPRLSGFLFQLGGRLGAEIQFGFLGVPQLALQGTVGLHFDYRTASVNTLDRNTNIESENSASRIGVSTGVFEEPWDLFVGGITAIYYL